MARINIEDSVYRDQRFLDLCISYQCKFRALGALVALWSIGQDYWKRDRALIPKDKWAQQRLPVELIELGFVIEKTHGFEVDGAENHFAWLVQKVNAGKKGGSSKNNNLEPSGAKRSQAQPNESKPLTLTLTPTLTQNKNNNAQRKRRACPFSRADFEKVYDLYPRKEGKSKGLDKCKTEIKTDADYQALGEAVSRYKAHCEAEAIEPRFIKHFATFMGSWRDWLDDDVGKSTIKNGKSWEEEFLEGVES